MSHILIFGSFLFYAELNIFNVKILKMDCYPTEEWSQTLGLQIASLGFLGHNRK